MPAASLLDILDEMEATLQAAYASVEPTVQVVGRLNLNPTGLSIDIYPGEPSTDETRGYGELTGELILTVRARVNTADHEAAQDALLRMMDEEDELCMAVALTDDPTLNGLVASMEVEPPSGFSRYVDTSGATLAGHMGAQIGVQWRVTVVRARS